MQITSVAIVLFAAMGAVANPIATQSDDLSARDIQLSKFGGECSLKHNTCTYLKGGKNHVVNCGSADNQKCKEERHHCEYDDHHKTVNCQTPV
ncbi:antifungal protein [Aspergillus sergii]|uniref:Antifungal protein n=1 Tax=Aspergillus sergii TaxID=1034303 RepID=A0A5N6XLN7_9EURO|nr:antifungal protein [Aspergillus sergii]